MISLTLEVMASSLTSSNDEDLLSGECNSIDYRVEIPICS